MIEHLLLRLWEATLCYRGLSPWNFVPLSCFCFCFLLLFAVRDLQSLNITLVSPASIEYFLYGSYQLNCLGDSGISANRTRETRTIGGVVLPMLRRFVIAREEP